MKTVKLYSDPEAAADLNEGTGLGFTVNMTYNSVNDAATEEIDNTYVRNIYMATGNTEDAAKEAITNLLKENAAEDESYSYVECDLNGGTESTTVIYIGSIYTKDPTKAIKGLLLDTTDEDAENSRFKYDEDGRKYEMVGINFNEGTKGNTINLYTTYDETGKILNDIGTEVSNYYSYSFYNDGKWSFVNKVNGSDKTDLNDGARGRYIYLWQRLCDYTAEDATPKFVKEVYIKTGDSFTDAFNELETELKELGSEYNMITFNLNEGTKESKAVVLGWTITENENEAIADLMLHHSSKDVLPETFEKEGLTYTRYNVNLNEGIEDGGFLYLYSARAEDAESLVSDIGVEMYSHFWSKSVKYFVQTEDWKYIKTYAGENKYDLNEDIGGDYVYLWYLPVSVVNENSDEDISDSDNKVSDTDNKDSDNNNSDKDNSDKDNSDKDTDRTAGIR